MAIDLPDLFEKAVFNEEIHNASESIERALEAYEAQKHSGARSFEVVAPDEADETWLRDHLLHPLIYFCESEGGTLPGCAGVLVTMFVGSHLYAIPADEVVRWASELLHAPIEELHAQYGTEALR